MLVSIVIPMKDEEGSLPVLEREMTSLRGLLAARGDRLELVLVDDCSADGTAATAQALCERIGGATLVRHDRNRGFGAGLRTGVRASKGDVVVSYDADCAYPAADVIPLLDALAGGADVATASPFAEGGEFHVWWFRRLLSRGCSDIYRTALGGHAQGVRTFTCAFRAYRGDLVRALHWRADRFLAAAEILSICMLRGARVVEVPSTLRRRFAGESKMKVVRTSVGHVLQAGRLALFGER